MTINGNCRSLLIGGVAVMAGLALAGCNRDSSTSTANTPATPAAPVATESTANPVGSTSPPSPADASAQPADETGNEVADMEHHHEQAMDHAEMRAGAAKPDALPPADSPPAPMPMKHM